ncbi:hypothetical protein [Sphingobacterium sp. DR205]|uniref:hypothetical protein n=1 Tax=Sphingobacterium sp. DR205 TaxID=2713573 RepID=UPI0013E51A38|nr:hypothetical protein [Sphingobacterium sp. DR205]QIH33471.1 hypothetical protein G6053_11495 [Sphingobacterium sp. DR205]
MNEQEMQEILENLASRGFDDHQLRLDIDRNMSYGLPRFSISIEKEFGAERMYYKLNFQWFESSLGYELTSIHANHRMPVDIDKIIVNGINSNDLDRDMTEVNWSKYWESKSNEGAAYEALAIVPHCIDGLAQLLLSESLQAKFTGESLMYKHWPLEVFSKFSEEPERMGRLYEHDYSFDLKEYPNMTAQLAFLIISERTDSLKMQFSDLGASQIAEPSVESEVYRRLKFKPEKAELTFSFSNQHQYCTLQVPVFLDNGWYNLDSYILGLVQFPDINHGTFNGVDSERLDKKMSTINWREDKDIAFTEKNAEVWFPRDIELLQEELFRMTFYQEGQEAADLLMLKHWLCAPIFEDFISERAKERLLSLPIKEAQFSSNIQVDKAIGLLSGRPVWKQLAIDQEHGIWQRLISPADGREAELETFEAISKKQLGSIYDMIPVPEYRKETILRQLLNGEAVVMPANNDQIIRLELTENVDGISIFDSNRREIPFNFQLEPDWTPDQSHAVDQREIRHLSATDPRKISVKSSNKKSKGRGL